MRAVALSLLVLIACAEESDPPPDLQLEKLAGSHILIQHEESRGDSKRSRDEARRLAEELSRRARAGEDFGQLAREFSEDPASRGKGGDLGVFRVDRYVSTIVEGLRALHFHAVSEPVESPYGYHVLRRRPAEFYAARHILIQHVDATVVPDSVTRSREEALLLIARLQRMLYEGADFANLAREHSEGSERERGGDLGIFSQSEMVEPFERAVIALQLGEHSDIVETIYGFHLILRTK